MGNNVTRVGKGVATLNQAKLIDRMESFDIPKYTGKTAREASEYITKWKAQYTDELLHRDDVASYLHQQWLDDDGHGQW